MTGRVQSLRSNVAGNRPASGSRSPGELYTNFLDRQIGVIDSTQTPMDLLAVRFFSTLAAYNTGDFVLSGGQLYQAKAAITAGAFNSANWNKVTTANDAQPNYVLKSGDTMSGALTLPYDPTLALHAATKQYVDNLLSSGAPAPRFVSGFGQAINAGLSVTTPSNTLVIQLVGNDGLTLATNNTCSISFRDPSLSSNALYWRNVQAPITLTLPAGTTLGVSGTIPYRVWIAAFDNGGTVVLGAYQSIYLMGTSTPLIWPVGPDVNNPMNTSAASPAVTTGATWVTPAALTGKPYTILGFLEFPQWPGTAGNWSAAPTRIQMAGPGTHMPGERVGFRYLSSSGGSTTATSATVVPGCTMAFTKAFTGNLLHVTAQGQLNTTNVASTNTTGYAQMFDGNGNSSQQVYAGSPSVAGGIGINAPFALEFIDYINASSCSFTLQFWSSASTNTVYVQAASMMVEEIMV